MHQTVPIHLNSNTDGHRHSPKGKQPPKSTALIAMTKSTPARTPAELVAELQASLAVGTQQPSRAEAQRELWSKLRPILGVNDGSTGLEAVGNIVEDIIADRPPRPLLDFVSLAPAPQHQRLASEFVEKPVGKNKTKASTKPVTKLSGSKRTQPSGGKKAKTSSPSGNKKVKTTPPPNSSSPGRLSNALAAAMVDPEAPPELLEDLDSLYRSAKEQGTKPFRLAYPWSGRRLWYAPSDYPSVYRAHFRFWMSHRSHFWEWAVNVPLRSDNAYGARRKRKMYAIRARALFLSICIETWVYYAFLGRFERADAHDQVFWMGGQPGEKSVEAKTTQNSNGPSVIGLSKLFLKDRAAYREVIEGALDPERIDADGYSDIPTMLALTDALNPRRKFQGSRLSDKALARIYRDIKSKRRYMPHWKDVGDLSSWQALRSSKRIRRLAEQLSDELRTERYVAPVTEGFDAAKDHRADFSDYEDDETHVPTALSPNGLRDGELIEEEDDAFAESKAAPAKCSGDDAEDDSLQETSEAMETAPERDVEDDEGESGEDEEDEEPGSSEEDEAVVDGDNEDDEDDDDTDEVPRPPSKRSKNAATPSK